MASTYLRRTPASTGNRQTWTYSVWFKKSKIGASGYQYLFNCTDNATSTGRINSTENSTDSFSFIDDLIGVNLTTTAVYRDVSAWYHLVVVLDTTNATSTNRVKMYVNGSQITSFSTSTYPSQNANGTINLVSGSYAHHIGTYIGGQSFFDGLMASVYFIDGQALTPSSFGETDATTGIWKPKAYTGTYGTNGFFLKFENGGSLGTDSSGNGNNWTVNGTPTQTVDTPSNVFCTINGLQGYTSSAGTIHEGSPVLSNGNTTLRKPSQQWSTFSSTHGVNKGKWYWETKMSDAVSVPLAFNGIKNIDNIQRNLGNTVGSNDGDIGYYSSNGNKKYVGTDAAYGSSYAVGDVIGVALDLDNNKIYFAKNNTWQNSGVPTSGATGTGAIPVTSGYTYVPAVTAHDVSINTNFGNGFFGTTAISSPYSDGAGLGKFQYQPPTGYYSLCTKNINVYG